VLSALVGAPQFDAAFAEALKATVVGPLREDSREVFRRAIAPVDRRLADGVVDLILKAQGLQGGGES